MSKIRSVADTLEYSFVNAARSGRLLREAWQRLAVVAAVSFHTMFIVGQSLLI